MALATDVLLGLVSFVIPGIVKGLIVRNRRMVIDAQAYVRSYIFENSLDPLGLLRIFREPQVMQSKAIHVSSPPRFTLIVGVMGAAVLTQALLIALQVLSGDRIVSTRSAAGLGVFFDPQAELNQDIPSCQTRATGDGAAISVSSCRDAFFEFVSPEPLPQNSYKVSIITTYGRRNHVFPHLYTVMILGFNTRRIVQITNRLVSEDGEYYVVANSTSEGMQRVVRRSADQFMFSTCKWTNWTVGNIVPHQAIESALVHCPEKKNRSREDHYMTSPTYNRFTPALASAFQIGGIHPYLQPSKDFSIAERDLQLANVVWKKERVKILPLWTVVLLSGGCIMLKIMIDVVLGEDNDYKTAHLVNEIANKSSAENLTNLKGALNYRWSTTHFNKVHRGYLHYENMIVDKAHVKDSDIIV